MMKQRPMEFRGGLLSPQSRVWLAGLCFAAAVTSGCAEHRVKAKVKTFPWNSAAAAARPVALKTVALTTADETADINSELALDVAPPPSPLVTVNGAPPRPRVPVAPPGTNNATKFEPMQIVPQLTPQETEAAQQQTNLSLSIAERNISAARGKALNPTQLDLASKVRSFVTEAREAAHIGDWTRASSAAKKAEVLSDELARSL
jgi:hypothetical protein